jgi:hypothetical protein
MRGYSATRQPGAGDGRQARILAFFYSQRLMQVAVIAGEIGAEVRGATSQECEIALLSMGRDIT